MATGIKRLMVPSRSPNRQAGGHSNAADWSPVSTLYYLHLPLILADGWPGRDWISSGAGSRSCAPVQTGGPGHSQLATVCPPISDTLREELCQAHWKAENGRARVQPGMKEGATSGRTGAEAGMTGAEADCAGRSGERTISTGPTLGLTLLSPECPTPRPWPPQKRSLAQLWAEGGREAILCRPR